MTLGGVQENSIETSYCLTGLSYWQIIEAGRNIEYLIVFISDTFQRI